MLLLAPYLESGPRKYKHVTATTHPAALKRALVTFTYPEFDIVGPEDRGWMYQDVWSVIDAEIAGVRPGGHCLHGQFTSTTFPQQRQMDEHL